MGNYTVFDAFTGISPFEKLGVIKFLEQHLGVPKSKIQMAVEYAIKDCPSFGGLILVVTQAAEPVAVAIIHKSGHNGHQASHTLAYYAISEKFQTEEFIADFFDKLINLSNGDLAMHLSDDHQVASKLEALGFRQTRVEYRFQNPNKLRLAV
ncbi:MAG: hypothetical protein R2879_13715 [Saprospiraceae bacterium]|jgi:hypothetical protein